jgi:excisionase family DNA binding protein
MNNAPLSYSIPDAVAASGIGRTTICGEIAAGRLRAVKRGRRTLILAQDLKAWVAELQPVQPKQPASAGGV